MTEEELSMEMAIRVAKWRSQLGDLHIKQMAMEYELTPKLRQLEDIKREIKQHEGSLSEAYSVQIFIEDSLRKQGKLGRDPNKHIGSVLDQAEKMEVKTGSGNDSRPWAKSGSVSI